MDSFLELLVHSVSGYVEAFVSFSDNPNGFQPSEQHIDSFVFAAITALIANLLLELIRPSRFKDPVIIGAVVGSMLVWVVAATGIALLAGLQRPSHSFSEIFRSLLFALPTSMLSSVFMLILASYVALLYQYAKRRSKKAEFVWRGRGYLAINAAFNFYTLSVMFGTGHNVWGTFLLVVGSVALIATMNGIHAFFIFAELVGVGR